MICIEFYIAADGTPKFKPSDDNVYPFGRTALTPDEVRRAVEAGPHPNDLAIGETKRVFITPEPRGRGGKIVDVHLEMVASPRKPS